MASVCEMTVVQQQCSIAPTSICSRVHCTANWLKEPYDKNERKLIRK